MWSNCIAQCTHICIIVKGGEPAAATLRRGARGRAALGGTPKTPPSNSRARAGTARAVPARHGEAPARPPEGYKGGRDTRCPGVPAPRPEGHGTGGSGGHSGGRPYGGAAARSGGRSAGRSGGAGQATGPARALTLLPRRTARRERGEPAARRRRERGAAGRAGGTPAQP